MIVQSFGALQHFGPSRSSAAAAPSSTATWDTAALTVYGQIYSTQPAVRTVVEFIARNIAELNLHVFRRVSDTDRERLVDHELARWINDPTPATTHYKLIDALMQDMGIYFCAYWLKVRLRDENRLGLVRLLPETVTPDGYLLPQAFYWTQPDGTVIEIAPKDLVYFSGYNPTSAIFPLSPLETLRQTLAEEYASRSYRRAFWQNSARLEGVIQRPKDAPKWTTDQKNSWREQWQARFVGQPGQVAVLEDGMTFQALGTNAKDAEYIEARKLTREEVAAAYHVPLPMVGILEHATFSNIREQHKNLYQDCLGPWLKNLQEELIRQVLPECDDTENIYCEFNINEKLKGSFEEQGEAIQRLVGRPVMTPNEGRARLNLPSIKNDPTADQLAMPLNTATSGQAAPVDQPELIPEATAPIIRRAWMRQEEKIRPVPRQERAAYFEATRVTRWDHELAEDLEPLYLAIGCEAAEAARRAALLAAQVNTDTAQLLIAEGDAFAAREAQRYV
jgi:HK97 family phage portal protein